MQDKGDRSRTRLEHWALVAEIGVGGVLFVAYLALQLGDNDKLL